MAVSLVQTTAIGDETTNDTAIALSVANPPTPGNTLIALGVNLTDTIGLAGVADGVNGAWTKVIHGADSGNAVWAAFVLVGRDMTGATITATLNSADTGKVMWVTEWSGVGRFQEKKTFTVSFNGTARNVGGSTVTPRVGGLIIGAWMVLGLGDESALTPAAGYSAFPTESGAGYWNSPTQDGFIEGIWREAATATAQQPTATGGASPIAYDALALAFDEKLTPTSYEQTQFPKPLLRSPVASR